LERNSYTELENGRIETLADKERFKRIPYLWQPWTEKTARIHYLKEIFDLCYFGKGGFDFFSVYNMPVYVRRSFLKMIMEKHKEEEQEIERQKKSARNLPQAKPPNISKYNNIPKPKLPNIRK